MLAEVAALLRHIEETGEVPLRAPYDLGTLFLRHCDVMSNDAVGDESVYSCVADLMWVANAHINMAHSPIHSEQTLEDFPLLQLPGRSLHEGCVSSFDNRALFDAVEGLMWVMDGNLLAAGDRAEAWHDQFHELFHLLQHRAYYLAINTLDTDVHNMEEHRRSKVLAARRVPEGIDSDDDDFGALDVRAADNPTWETTVGMAFVFDFNSMLSHMELSMRAAAGLTCHWRGDVSTAALRTRVIEVVSNPAHLPALVDFRRAYQHKLEVNRADRRIFFRKEPLRGGKATDRMVLINKHEKLAAEAGIPKTIEDMFIKRVDASARAMYRLNTDAALMFLSQQELDGVLQLVVLEDWEPLPALPTPRIIRIRAKGTWGVVFAWPDVLECRSVMQAYLVLLQEMALRGMDPVWVVNMGRGLPARHMPLEF
jgi:hypothetical protein